MSPNKESSVSHFSSRIPLLLENQENSILSEWLRLLKTSRGDHLEENARAFLVVLREATGSGNLADISRPEWNRMRELLNEISRDRAENGFAPSETARFVFSFKQPLFEHLRKEFEDGEGLAEEIWQATDLLDKLGLYTTEIFQKSREEIIRRQQQELLELSTPVVSLWEGILALPLIGTLDSARTQVVMQNLLEAIVSHGAAIAIIDITGVPTVDTLVAQHLLKTVGAARLMGADCIISGIRPQIAQTIIHLGIDLVDVTTKATLADAFQLALKKLGFGLATASSRPSQV